MYPPEKIKYQSPKDNLSSVEKWGKAHVIVCLSQYSSAVTADGIRISAGSGHN